MYNRCVYAYDYIIYDQYKHIKITAELTYKTR